MVRRLRDVDVEATPTDAGVAAAHPCVIALPPRPYCSDRSARVVLPLSLMPLASSFGATTNSRDESIFLLIHWRIALARALASLSRSLSLPCVFVAFSFFL